VALRMRFDDFSRATRSTTITEPTAQTQKILATARGLLATAMPLIESQGITLIGVSLTNLEDDWAIQLALPFDRQRESAIDAVLDDIRDRFGTRAITRAVLLGRDNHITVPLLPD
jgi:DNA polymerase-4